MLYHVVLLSVWRGSPMPVLSSSVRLLHCGKRWQQLQLVVLLHVFTAAFCRRAKELNRSIRSGGALPNNLARIAWACLDCSFHLIALFIGCLDGSILPELKLNPPHQWNRNLADSVSHQASSVLEYTNRTSPGVAISSVTLKLAGVLISNCPITQFLCLRVMSSINRTWAIARILFCWYQLSLAAMAPLFATQQIITSRCAMEEEASSRMHLTNSSARRLGFTAGPAGSHGCCQFLVPDINNHHILPERQVANPILSTGDTNLVSLFGAVSAFIMKWSQHGNTAPSHPLCLSSNRGASRPGFNENNQQVKPGLPHWFGVYQQ
ncbi:hypothetical protein B0T16DRAFT_191348 [Cercophora newfieldiana]|uniref:Uncharacterized protein n=1 Tax=Cercophora newfieldiana TaxID=92897 RepID=A0AA40CMG3_9PEZI|nr:hypothetical protein B0T16DRAFT_191348 [Cercophora newfieldiana]